MTEPLWVVARKSTDAEESGGRRILQSHSRTGGPKQGQLPWIAYSPRDFRVARAEQLRRVQI